MTGPKVHLARIRIALRLCEAGAYCHAPRSRGMTVIAWTYSAGSAASVG
ncbi:hypothetical protein AB7M16_002285 [Bradyrhizobium sp. USDA 372]